MWVSCLSCNNMCYVCVTELWNVFFGAGNVPFVVDETCLVKGRHCYLQEKVWYCNIVCHLFMNGNFQPLIPARRKKMPVAVSLSSKNTRIDTHWSPQHGQRLCCSDNNRCVLLSSAAVMLFLNLARTVSYLGHCLCSPCYIEQLAFHCRFLAQLSENRILSTTVRELEVKVWPFLFSLMVSADFAAASLLKTFLQCEG